jgi:hypothetical protein
MKALAAGLLAWSVALLASGCRSQPVVSAGPRGPAPAYEQVAAAYNQRVSSLERLWARTVVRLSFVDGDGNPQSEQVEGHCQYVRPSKVLVSFHKAGQPLAMLGSNEERFWWIELGNNKRAFVGTHAAATPERIATAGLRVHPLDLMELLGLTPLPGSGEGRVVEWSANAMSLVVTIPGKNASRRLFLDPVTFRPSRVESVDAAGKVGALSELSKYQAVAMKAAGPEVIRPWVPTHVRIEADSGATRVIMELSDPQNDPARFKPVAFDLDRLLEANGVQDVRDLDKEGRAALER